MTTIQTWFLIILGRSTYFWPLELAFWSGTLVKNWCSKIELHSRTDWQSQSYICMLLLSASQSCKENIRGGLFIFKYPAPLSTKNRQIVHSVWNYFESIKRNVDISNQKVPFFGFPPTVQPIKTPTNFLCLFWDMVTLVKKMTTLKLKRKACSQMTSNHIFSLKTKTLVNSWYNKT